jgi:UPF0176 protein
MKFISTLENLREIFRGKVLRTNNVTLHDPVPPRMLLVDSKNSAHESILQFSSKSCSILPNMQSDFQILLYYKYVTIENPHALMAAQRELCAHLKLTGRILIAKEGINGTVEGTRAATEEYVRKLFSDSRFSDIHMKRSVGTGTAFNKLKIKVRDEIVGTHFPPEIDPTKQTAPHISAEELHALIHSDEKIHIVDMRNDYEFKIGHFENSIMPSLENSRDLAESVKEIAHLKNEKVVTVCTGGVRCEKMSAYLLREGFTNVSQLSGGIVTYMEKYPNKDFKGKLYVFDNRIAMGFETDSPEHEIIAQCEHCGARDDNYINCMDLKCHKQFFSCVNCVAAGKIVCPTGCVITQKAHNH